MEYVDSEHEKTGNSTTKNMSMLRSDASINQRMLTVELNFDASLSMFIFRRMSCEREIKHQQLEWMKTEINFMNNVKIFIANPQVMDAEKQKAESGADHQEKTRIFHEAESKVCALGILNTYLVKLTLN